MIDFFTAIKQRDLPRKMEVNELLFVEYTCLAEETRLGIWSDNNYFAFITSGRKVWKTLYNSYEVHHGDILFVKKGANLTHQFFDDEFCGIFLFIPDDFIIAFLKRHPFLLDAPQQEMSSQDAVLKITTDELLNTYCQSVRSYLSLSEMPNGQLLMLKFEELLLSLFSSDRHRELTAYFISLCRSAEYRMGRVMEDNFGYNLKLEDYARLCHMSLSTFKKSFKDHYNTTPAAWLKSRKLDLALQKVRSPELSISQVAFECGFEDTSHFIRVFKEKYQVTPLQYRRGRLKTAVLEA